MCEEGEEHLSDDDGGENAGIDCIGPTGSWNGGYRTRGIFQRGKNDQATKLAYMRRNSRIRMLRLRDERVDALQRGVYLRGSGGVLQIYCQLIAPEV